MASQLALLQEAFPDAVGRFAEVGAGVGFLVHLASWMGWDCVGVEPSPAGDAAREILGAPVRREFLEAAGLPRDCDAIVATEVIEHVPQPDDFVAQLAQHLARRGVLLLTTPNADVLADGRVAEVEAYESFGPGAHLTIFSASGMRVLLGRHGFDDVRIVECEGSSGRKRLVVLAARETGRFPEKLDWVGAQARGQELLRRYLAELIVSRRRNGRRDSVYAGALGRLAELLVAAGCFDEAESHLAAFDALLEELGVDEAEVRSLRADVLVSFLRRAPASIGSHYFLKGMVALLHRRDLPDAQRFFGLAAHVFALQESVLPHLFVPGRSARARLQEGIAFFVRGRREEAVRIFESVLRFPVLWPDVRRDLLWQKAIAHLQLGQNGAALAALSELAVDDATLVAPAHQALARHVLLAATQLVGGLEAKIGASAEALRALSVSGERTLEILGRVADAASAHAARLEELHKQYELLRGELAGAASAVRRDLDRIAGALESLAWTVRLPIRTVRAASRALRRPFRARDPVPATPPPPGEGGQIYGPVELQRLPGSVVCPDGTEVAVGELTAGRILEQHIICPEDGLAAVWVKLGTYGRESRAHIQLDIIDAEGQCLRRVVEPTAACADNEMHRFAFDPIVDSKDVRYTIALSSPDARRGEGVAVWCRAMDSEVGLRVDGRVAHGRIVCELGFAPPATERHLLIVTPDTIVEPRIGIGMRHWEIARALSQRGLRVTLASVRPVPPGLRGDGFEVVPLGSDAGATTALVRRHAAVLVQGDVLHCRSELARVGTRLIADMVTPIHVESLEVGREEYAAASEIIRKCLRRGDFFICGNERQRLYWLGMLTAHGRLAKEHADADKELRGLIDVVGFGVPEEPPVKTRNVLKGVVDGIDAHDFVLLWFGGIWDWLDPLTLVRAAHLAHVEEPRIKLYFAFFRLPNREPTRMAYAARALAAEIGALDRSVFFGDIPVPHERRADYLCECDVGVLCQADNLETQLSARTRVLDYIWAGRPILVNAGGEAAELVERYGLGLVVPTRDAGAFRDAILALVRTPGLWSEKAANVERIRPRFYWTHVVEPIVKHLEVALRTKEGQFELTARRDDSVPSVGNALV